ncbi:NAD(P)-dependent malic enzyme [Selenihalanaerobacter shriftii]|uniref:Malate dehydrogenase (Oxaloacetate-decarboxylating) n=1 Tax=Selenihalanaerobacter shriftii TaxID=142842 RepID=A0A1T4K7T0_9FIRM|nr:malic enzyme-like NAD(P)-binding protein [Selenihalanaerobacter shriftii]SJZ38482.1 malate dehydrogenase (oxaloacetate-decarboxylating) [Selenihalanaerobacter shriftii]
MIIKEDALMGYETPEEKEKKRLKKKKKKQKKQGDEELSYTKQSLEIIKDPKKVYEYTDKGKRVAVISDGSAVLNLGAVGPKAALPIVESKARLLQRYGKVEAIPLCLDTEGVDELVTIIKGIASTYGVIFLEDIAAPNCIELQQRLQAELDIPVYHDDQQGTAIVVLAALYNSLRITNKNLADLKVVINGAGTAGLAITKLLLAVDVGEIILCDKEGILTPGSKELNFAQKEMIRDDKINVKPGNLETALIDADVFIGVSTGDVLDKESINKMRRDPIIFALATPTSEIDPKLAKSAGAKVVATAYNRNSNQINNQLVFSGLIKGLLEAKADNLSLSLQVITAKAIAQLVDQVRQDNILPDPSDPEVISQITEKVIKAVNSEEPIIPQELEENLPLEVVEHLSD